jgi:hypothetical protein
MEKGVGAGGINPRRFSLRLLCKPSIAMLSGYDHFSGLHQDVI